MTTRFTQADATHIVTNGTRMIKRPSPIYVMQQDDYFVVETKDGWGFKPLVTLRGNPGDYVIFDPIVGQVCLVTADHLKRYYQEPADNGKVGHE